VIGLLLLDRIDSQRLPTGANGYLIASVSGLPLREMTFARITVNAAQMGGTPCIRGLRIPVATVVGMLADGMSGDEVLAAYPDLERDDLSEALRYAAEAVRERELPLAAAG
jgi:uncharacterized protein (DUF433 family)